MCRRPRDRLGRREHQWNYYVHTAGNLTYIYYKLCRFSSIRAGNPLASHVMTPLHMHLSVFIDFCFSVRSTTFQCALFYFGLLCYVETWAVGWEVMFAYGSRPIPSCSEVVKPLTCGYSEITQAVIRNRAYDSFRMHRRLNMCACGHPGTHTRAHT